MKKRKIVNINNKLLFIFVNFILTSDLAGLAGALSSKASGMSSREMLSSRQGFLESFCKIKREGRK